MHKDGCTGNRVAEESLNLYRKRLSGLEPETAAWKAVMLPLHHRRELNFSRSEPSFDGLGGFEPPDFDFADHCVIHFGLLDGSHLSGIPDSNR